MSDQGRMALPAGATVLGPAGLCEHCARAIRHDLCTGPPCCCLQCRYRTIKAAARAHLASPRVADSVLRRDIASLLALLDQREQRAIKLAARPDLPPFPCACGRTDPQTGQPCMVTGARNHTRRFASHACRQHDYVRNQRLSRQDEAMSSAVLAIHA